MEIDEFLMGLKSPAPTYQQTLGTSGQQLGKGADGPYPSSCLTGTKPLLALAENQQHHNTSLITTSTPGKPS